MVLRKRKVEKEYESCDFCKREAREYNDWCVACGRAMCDWHVSEENDYEDGAICKSCEKKGFEIVFIHDKEEDRDVHVLYFKGKRYNGETYW
jgi:hypothetical protein